MWTRLYFLLASVCLLNIMCMQIWEGLKKKWRLLGPRVAWIHEDSTLERPEFVDNPKCSKTQSDFTANPPECSGTIRNKGLVGRHGSSTPIFGFCKLFSHSG